MNVNSMVSDLFSHTKTNIEKKKAVVNYKSGNHSAKKKMDSLEISSEAYDMQAKDEKMDAASGKDSLGITKGSKENTYVIHFSDTAILSRAASRGYITVNGVKIALSDEVKEQLIKVNEQAQADREKAYSAYILQHEMAVAQQQSETWKKAYEDLSKAFEIAAKISGGGKATSSEIKLLMAVNPQLYAMAQSAAITSEQQEKQITTKTEKSEMKHGNTSDNGVSWSQFEWKSYETQMVVSMEETPEIQTISEGEIVLN